MTGQGKLLTGVIVGGSAMYLLDPECGGRRRSLLLDQGLRVRHRLGDRLAAAAREIRSRPELAHANSALTTRLLLGTAGGLLAFKGTRTKGPVGKVFTAVGLGLLSRAATSVLPRRPVELGTGARSIEAKLEAQTTLADAEPVGVGEVVSSAPARKSSTKSTTKPKSTTRRRRPRE